MIECLRDPACLAIQTAIDEESGGAARLWPHHNALGFFRFDNLAAEVNGARTAGDNFGYCVVFREDAPSTNGYLGIAGRTSAPADGQWGTRHQSNGDLLTFHKNITPVIIDLTTYTGPFGGGAADFAIFEDIEAAGNGQTSLYTSAADQGSGSSYARSGLPAVNDRFNLGALPGGTQIFTGFTFGFLFWRTAAGTLSAGDKIAIRAAWNGSATVEGQSFATLSALRDAVGVAQVKQMQLLHENAPVLIGTAPIEGGTLVFSEVA